MLFLANSNSAAGILAVVLLIVGIIVFIGLLIYISSAMAKKRAREMLASLSGLGFSAVPDEIPTLTTLLQQFAIGRRGHGRRLTNPFRVTDAAGETVYVMDYAFTEGHGKSASHLSYSLFLHHRPQLQSPSFMLAPEGFFSRIGQVFGAKDFDFETHPVFSKSYQLQGPDEAAVRQYFSSDLLTGLEQRPGWSVQGQGGYLLIYRENKRPRVADLPKFIDDARGISILFPNA